MLCSVRTSEPVSENSVLPTRYHSSLTCCTGSLPAPRDHTSYPQVPCFLAGSPHMAASYSPLHTALNQLPGVPHQTPTPATCLPQRHLANSLLAYFNRYTSETHRNHREQNPTQAQLKSNRKVNPKYTKSQPLMCQPSYSGTL